VFRSLTFFRLQVKKTAQKHLMHLKVIQQMSNVPRSVGIPPLNDASFDQALTVPSAAAAAAHSPIPMTDDGRINPLAGMGLTDEQYASILQNMVSGQNFGDGMVSEKRPLDDGPDGRDLKRSRFEVLE
jgi:osomolarity two-component system response regulator SKN7